MVLNPKYIFQYGIKYPVLKTMFSGNLIKIVLEDHFGKSYKRYFFKVGSKIPLSAKLV